jgi:hypothetical protein
MKMLSRLALGADFAPDIQVGSKKCIMTMSESAMWIFLGQKTMNMGLFLRGGDGLVPLVKTVIPD